MHDLHPGDIRIIGAMGDSLTVMDIAMITHTLYYCFIVPFVQLCFHNLEKITAGKFAGIQVLFLTLSKIIDN